MKDIMSMCQNHEASDTQIKRKTKYGSIYDGTNLEIQKTHFHTGVRKFLLGICRFLICHLGDIL